MAAGERAAPSYLSTRTVTVTDLRYLLTRPPSSSWAQDLHAGGVRGVQGEDAPYQGEE